MAKNPGYATDMLRQCSTRSTVSMASEYVESDEDMDDYYNDFSEHFDGYPDDVHNDDVTADDSGVVCGDAMNTSRRGASVKDPEYFEYALLEQSDAKALFRSSAEVVRTSCHVTLAHAQMMLQRGEWNVNKVVQTLKRNNSHLIDNNNDVDFAPSNKKRRVDAGKGGECMVCFISVDELKTLECEHGFCDECWTSHIETQIQSGVFGKINCMEPFCETLLSEEFVLSLLVDPDLKMKYQEFSFRERIVSHPELRFCPGLDCNRVVRAPNPQARRVNCDKCQSTFCFGCGQNYHAPVNCADIKKWVQKLEDDSETANYISENTKDCPKCNVCIEKNGGCNHMQCFKCQHDFCWVCLKDWASHDSYYECSKYKEGETNTDLNSSRKALEKYLFYFQRWENHTQSLQLEMQMRGRIQAHIEKKVMQCQGTWIDWQYLLDACTLLHRCRYTLKYTYPYAYFLDPEDSTKGCFEHIQAQLEQEVENLAWKVERAEITDRADLERQMDVAEKRRLTLLHDYLQK